MRLDVEFKAMKPTSLARLLNVSGQTLRRWTDTYGRFLSPGATPPRGRPRALSDRDIRVLYLVSVLRNTGQDPDRVLERLEAEQAQDWPGLPEIPPEWKADPGSTVSVELAASRAYDIAQVAVLQSELQQAEKRIQELSLSLQDARERAEKLENDLETLRTHKEASDHAQHALELELAQARTEIGRLEGELKSYGLGRGTPINVGLLLASAVIFGVVLVVVVFIVATLIR
jgi:DNA-binding transcriptional MerR regulator